MSFNVGDTVRCVQKKLGTVIEGTIRSMDRYGDWVAIAGTIGGLDFDEWDVSLVERAQPELPELPTESGSVVRIANDDDRWHWLFWLAKDGTWDAIDFRGKGFHAIDDPYMWLYEQDEDVLTMQVLEPVADTARKVLDAVSAEMDNVHWSTSTAAIGAVWAAVRNRFGVQS